MCLLAIQYKLVADSPILVACNREEAFDREALPPSIQSGKPRVLCATDKRSGGTWLGVNQNGLFVAACNRITYSSPLAARSRGLLCRDLLRRHTARQAVDSAMHELGTNKYEGVNLIIADGESGWVVHGGDEHQVVPLKEGLSIITNGDVNDPRDERIKLCRRLLTLQMLDSPVKFLAVASKVFSRPPMPDGRPSIIVRGKEKGTVSSTLISLGAKPRDAIFQYADGAPDSTVYEDYSPMLRDILSRGLRESRTKAKA
ncbi:MAG: NRDE family protein [Pirellulaceae bacterium]|nr:NRDE family protein [Planctomycetales bacterium]MCA9164825.1 NRDE family protein [Planctomycetales bacterium]MCA9228565.1 NRDE family protein [Planctomycetales bacterium]